MTRETLENAFIERHPRFPSEGRISLLQEFASNVRYTKKHGYLPCHVRNWKWRFLAEI